MELRNTEHGQNTGTLGEHTIEYWQNNWTTTKWWNMRRAAEQRNKKTIPRNVTNTEKQHIEQIT